MCGGQFRAFLSYFSVTSHLFPSYFSNISHFLTISQLFLTYFSKISHFPTISGLFLSNFSLFNYFWTISHLLLNNFSVTSRLVPVISRLFPDYSSSSRITCLSWFAQQCVLNEVLNEANETIRDYFQREVVHFINCGGCVVEYFMFMHHL